LVGSLLRIKDVLSLFLISMLIQQFLLLFGTYLCRANSFQKPPHVIRYDRCFASTVWASKILFNFSHFLFIAARFYFLVLFSKTKNLSRFGWQALHL